jgi:hypothetical protein
MTGVMAGWIAVALTAGRPVVVPYDDKRGRFVGLVR